MFAAEEIALAGGTGPKFMGHFSPCRDARSTGNWRQNQTNPRRRRQLHRPPMQTLPWQSALVTQTAPVAGPASEGLASLPVTASQATLEPGMRLSAETSTMP